MAGGFSGFFKNNSNELVNEIENLKKENGHLKTILKEAQTRLEKERNFLFALIDGIPAYVYLQDKDYSIKYANKVFYEWYGGYDMKPCYRVMHGRDIPCENCTTFRVFETKEPQIWVHRDIHKKTIFRVYDYPFIDNDGNELVLEMGINITDHQQAEDSRSNLYANISHELRTPLTKIMGYAEAIVDSNNSAEQYKNFADCIYKNSLALNRLINDLFELSKLETSAKLDFKLINLNKVIFDFCVEQEFYFSDKKRIFLYEIEPDLPAAYIDVNRLIQVFSNIVENALRYTEIGDTISLKAYTENESIIISIADTGEGINLEDIKYIFNRFYQGKRKEYREENRGLGLHICKTIIEQHSGKIWAENQMDKGAAFFIKLPFAASGSDKSEK